MRIKTLVLLLMLGSALICRADEENKAYMFGWYVYGGSSWAPGYYNQGLADAVTAFNRYEAPLTREMGTLRSLLGYTVGFGYVYPMTDPHEYLMAETGFTGTYSGSISAVATNGKSTDLKVRHLTYDIAIGRFGWRHRGLYGPGMNFEFSWCTPSYRFSGGNYTDAVSALGGGIKVFYELMPYLFSGWFLSVRPYAGAYYSLDPFAKILAYAMEKRDYVTYDNTPRERSTLYGYAGVNVCLCYFLTYHRD